MSKKIISLFIIIIVATAAMVDTMSNGAPASSTGAPGETSCTMSGCHDDNVINSGGGVSSLALDNGLSYYVPGTTYTVHVQISQSNSIRFGFQLIALKDADSSNIGTFNITEASRTQLLSGTGNLSSRKYVTYTYPGTNAVTPGNGSWSFQWTAPFVDEGPITLYLATVAANDDGTDGGDHCYLSSLQLYPTALGVEQFSAAQQFSVFPNPSSDQIKVHYSLKKTSAVKLELLDLKGTKLESWNFAAQLAGTFDQTVNLNYDCPKGLYLLRFTMDDKETIVKKITINK